MRIIRRLRAGFIRLLPGGKDNRSIQIQVAFLVHCRIDGAAAAIQNGGRGCIRYQIQYLVVAGCRREIP